MSDFLTVILEGLQGEFGLSLQGFFQRRDQMRCQICPKAKALHCE